MIIRKLSRSWKKKLLVVFTILFLLTGWTGKIVLQKRAEALLRGVTQGDLPAVQAFLRQGNPVNAPIGMTSVQGSLGNVTPLIFAADGGKLATVAFLLSQGADVNAKISTGDTALMGAAINGHASVVTLLLDKGADINARNGAGSTALMGACEWGQDDKIVETVKVLLSRGASVKVQDRLGETALDYAQNGCEKADWDIKHPSSISNYHFPSKASFETIVKLLKQAGAKK